MKRYLTLLIIILIGFTEGSSQNGGRYAFEYLSLPMSARITGLGGYNVSTNDGDLALSISNPALMDSTTMGTAQVSYHSFFAGINHATMSYAFPLNKWGLQTVASIAYINYGDFIKADALGNKDGTFSGGETTLIYGVHKNINSRIDAGINLKLALGSIDAYSSGGIAVDLGLLYHVLGKNADIGITLKNVGYVVDGYGSTKRSMPFDVQIGLSKRLKHLPFRYSLTLHHLHRWDVSYDRATQETDFFGNPIVEETGFVDNLFRHLNIGGEFLLGKRGLFKLRFGYNHMRRKELSLLDFRSLAGFSGGVGISIKGFKLDYGLGYFHVAGAAHHLTISTDMNRFL